MKNIMTVAAVSALAWPVVASAGEPDKGHHESGRRAMHEAVVKTHEPAFHGPEFHGPALPSSNRRRENLQRDPVVRGALHSDPFVNALPRSELKALGFSRAYLETLHLGPQIALYVPVNGSTPPDTYIPPSKADQRAAVARYIAEIKAESAVLPNEPKHENAALKFLESDPNANGISNAELQEWGLSREYLAALQLGPVTGSLVKDFAEGLTPPTKSQQEATIKAFIIRFDKDLRSVHNGGAALNPLNNDPYVNALPKSLLKADKLLPQYLATLGVGMQIDQVIKDYSEGLPKPTIAEQKAAIRNYEIAHSIPVGDDRREDKRGNDGAIKVLLERDPTLLKALTSDPYVNALDPAVLKKLHLLPAYLATLNEGPAVSSLIVDYADSDRPVPTINQQKAAILAFAVRHDLLNPPHKTWTPSRIETRYEVDDHHYAQSLNHNVPTQPTYCRGC